MYAECVGISKISAGKRARADELVDRVLSRQTTRPFVTNLTEHHIDVQGTAPMKHKTRHMSPKILEIAHKKVKRLY